MIEEHRRVYRVSLAVVLVAAAVALPHDRAVARSLVLGIVLYYVYLLVLTRTVSAQLEAAVFGGGAQVTGYLLRMAVLALPLLIAALHQEHLNVLAAFAPILVNHFVTIALYAREGVAA